MGLMYIFCFRLPVLINKNGQPDNIELLVNKTSLGSRVGFDIGSIVNKIQSLRENINSSRLPIYEFQSLRRFALT